MVTFALIKMFFTTIFTLFLGTTVVTVVAKVIILVKVTMFAKVTICNYKL